jgi:hypothetical protein
VKHDKICQVMLLEEKKATITPAMFFYGSDNLLFSTIILALSFKEVEMYF